MAVTCARCGSTTEGLPAAPVPTPLGAEIQARVCPSCWQEWLRAQVILINEYRLTLIDPQARAMLEDQMRQFLGLDRSRPV
jgi:Fe-S cluster biosynthesis and repair protein YggX